MRVRKCDTIGAEGSVFGIGVGEPCPNDGTHAYAFWWFCDECYKKLMIHRSGNGWGKIRGGRRDRCDI
jgi:hypothetical protein